MKKNLLSIGLNLDPLSREISNPYRLSLYFTPFKPTVCLAVKRNKKNQLGICFGFRLPSLNLSTGQPLNSPVWLGSVDGGKFYQLIAIDSKEVISSLAVSIFFLGCFAPKNTSRVSLGRDPVCPDGSVFILGTHIFREREIESEEGEGYREWRRE